MESPKELEGFFVEQRKELKSKSDSLKEKFNQNSSNADWNPLEVKQEFDLLQDDHKKITKLESRFNTEYKDLFHVLEVANLIHQKKFALVPKLLCHTMGVSIGDPPSLSTDPEGLSRLVIRKGNSRIEYPCAHHFLSSATIKISIIENKPIIVSAVVKDKQGQLRSLPVSETAFLFTEERLFEMAMPELVSEDEDEDDTADTFKIIEEQCYVVLMQ